MSEKDFLDRSSILNTCCEIKSLYGFKVIKILHQINCKLVGRVSSAYGYVHIYQDSIADELQAGWSPVASVHGNWSVNDFFSTNRI